MFNKKKNIIKNQEQEIENLKSKVNKSFDFINSFYNYRGGDAHKSFSTDFIYDSRNILESIEFYQKVAPLRYIIDKIANSCSQINMQVFVDGVKSENHPIYELINNPNIIQSKEKFLKTLYTQYLATGNIFIQTNSNSPSELYLLEAYNMTIDSNNQNNVINIPKRYMYSDSGYNNSFNLDLDTYIYSSNADQLLLPILDFTLNRQNLYFGVPKTFSLRSELLQWLEGNLNNLSTLKRGGRPSMFWVNSRNEPLTDEQYDRVVDLKKNFDGSGNAGGTGVLDGLDVKTIDQSNNDMQYQQLRKENKIEIANAFGFPLQLLLDGTMTYNNLATSMVQYYDNAVLPVINDVLSQMSKFFSKIYNADIDIRYNEYEIAPLRYRALEQAKLKASLGVTTVNEIREDISMDDIVGGDSLTQSKSTNDVNKNFEYLKNKYVKDTERSQ